MLAIVVALLVGGVVGSALGVPLHSWGWGIFAGAIGFMGSSYYMARIMMKKLTHISNRVQELVKAGQDEAMRLANRFQAKPFGSPKLVQDQVEKVIEKAVMEAIASLEDAKPLYRWNLLAERQVATMKFQLYFQIKHYDEADKYLDKALINMDAILICMKMARQYAKDDPTLDKTYRKGVKKFKYDKGVLLHALYSWILVKRKDIDGAVKVLVEAKEKAESEVLTRNWQNLANGKPQLFSNRELGDQWYSLGLEQPQAQRPSKSMVRQNPMFGGRGKRRFG
jgi:tetratricopeptide (TPR) repeat protein